MKNYHDQRIEKPDFVLGDLVFLLNSMLCLFLGKIKWNKTCPFLLKKLFRHRAVELENSERTRFKVN